MDIGAATNIAPDWAQTLRLQCQHLASMFNLKICQCEHGVPNLCLFQPYLAPSTDAFSLKSPTSRSGHGGLKHPPDRRPWDVQRVSDAGSVGPRTVEASGDVVKLWSKICLKDPILKDLTWPF